MRGPTTGSGAGWAGLWGRLGGRARPWGAGLVAGGVRGSVDVLVGYSVVVTGIGLGNVVR